MLYNVVYLHKIVLCVVVFRHTTTWITRKHAPIFPLEPPSHCTSTPPLQIIAEHWAELPVLCSSFLLAIFLIHGNMCILMLLPVFMFFLFCFVLLCFDKLALVLDTWFGSGSTFLARILHRKDAMCSCCIT